MKNTIKKVAIIALTLSAMTSFSASADEVKKKRIKCMNGDAMACLGMGG